MKRTKDAGVTVVTLSIVLNIILLVLKGIVGVMTNSAALQADAVNSAGDTISSLAILFGIKFAMRPQDEDYHYGYGKMEALVSFIVGLIILASTAYLWITIISTIKSSSYFQPSFWALMTAVVAILVKILLYIRTMRVGKQINSIAVQTNAKDHRNDIIATAGTVIAIGLSLIGSKLGIIIFKYAEIIAAAITSIFILKAGLEIVTSSTKMLMDAAPDDNTLEKLEKTVAKCEGVLDLDWLKCRTIGRGLLVEVAVEVDPDLSIKEGHAIDDNIIKTIHNEFKDVLEVQVQINPDEDF